MNQLHFNMITEFLHGKPCEKLLWYMDFDPERITNAPNGPDQWIAIADSLGCTYPRGIVVPYTERYQEPIRHHVERLGNIKISLWADEKNRNCMSVPYAWDTPRRKYVNDNDKFRLL